MASDLVVRHRCSRCPREWYEPYVEGQAKPVPASVKVEFKPSKKAAVSISFDSLCSTCSSTVEGYLDLMNKQVKHKSPTRVSGKKDAPGAKKGAPEGPSHNPAD